MNPTIHRVFYVSRATREFDSGTIQSILLLSRRDNAKLDVTGCLLFSGRYFAQVLEGRSDVVSSLVARIATDDRHRDLRLFRLPPSDRRDYDGWSMGYLHDLDLEDELHALVEAGGAPPDDMAGLVARIRPDAVMGALH